MPWAAGMLCPWGMLLPRGVLQHGQCQLAPPAVPVTRASLAAPLKLVCCCRMGIANRDLKLENTLLDRRGPDALLKICDFGYSINENTSMPRSAVGTPGYTGEGLRLPAGQGAGHSGEGAQAASCQSAVGTPGGTGERLQDRLAAFIMLRTRSAPLVHMRLVQAAWLGQPSCGTGNLSRPQSVCRRSSKWRGLHDGSGTRLASGHTGGTRPRGYGKMLSLHSAGAGSLTSLLKLVPHPRPAAYALGAAACCSVCFPQLPVLHAHTPDAAAMPCDLLHLGCACAPVLPAAVPSEHPLAAHHPFLSAAAPEVLFTHTRTYDAKRADVWSTGVMLYAMLFCRYPFEESSSRWAARLHLLKPWQCSVLCVIHERLLTQQHAWPALHRLNAHHSRQAWLCLPSSTGELTDPALFAAASLLPFHACMHCAQTPVIC